MFSTKTDMEGVLEVVTLPKDNFGFELGYFNLFQQRPSGVHFYNRNIIRLTFHQTLNLKNSKS